MVTAGLAVVAKDIWDGHKARVWKMRSRPVEAWGRMETEFFETAPDANEVAYAVNPGGCATVVRPTFATRPQAVRLAPAPRVHAPMAFLEVPEFNPELARTVMAGPRRRAVNA